MVTPTSESEIETPHSKLTFLPRQLQLEEQGELSDSSTDNIVCPRKKPCLGFDSDSDGGNNKEVVIRPPLPIKVAKSTIVKGEDDFVPLPDPFDLPKHYRADVEAALACKTMTKDTTKAFFSSVASSMLKFKRYPTKEDYLNVSRVVVTKYPFLASPVGTPTVSVIFLLLFLV